MNPHLLTIPHELRLRILEYAVTLEPIIVCRGLEDHYTKTRPWVPIPHGLAGNPRLSLYLICTQITSELASITVPGLELKMCDATCVGEYFEQWASMGAHVSSVEALVEDDFDYQLSNDQIAEELLQNTESSWASRVEMIELEMSGSIYGNEKRATGRVIFRR